MCELSSTKMADISAFNDVGKVKLQSVYICQYDFSSLYSKNGVAMSNPGKFVRTRFWSHCSTLVYIVQFVIVR